MYHFNLIFMICCTLDSKFINPIKYLITIFLDIYVLYAYIFDAFLNKMLKTYLQHIEINVAFVSNTSSCDEYKFHHSNLD